MKYPQMIIFDYGQTLLCEPNHNPENGSRALWEYVNSNPHRIPYQEYNRLLLDTFAKIRKERGNVEVHEHHFLRLILDYFGIEFSVSLEEAETIIWNGISEGAVMPHADIMLDHLNKIGIRTAVISNLTWSGHALQERLNRLLPNNRFEFVMASSEYVFKKPDKMIFEIALRKAGLQPDEVWYCGDSIAADVYGAHGAGIFPVLYEGLSAEPDPYPVQNEGLTVDFDYLHIHDWLELVEKFRNQEADTWRHGLHI